MKLLTPLLIALLFLTGCTTLDLRLTDAATGQPISGANIRVQYVSNNQENKDLDIVGDTTTDASGHATLEALYKKHKDLQLFITRQNDRYQTILIRHNITNYPQSVTGLQSLKSDQKFPDPSTPSIKLQYQWGNSEPSKQ